MYDVYKIVNNVNGKLYIGYSKDIKQRWRNHVRCSIKQCKEHEYPLYKSMRKHGQDNFSLHIIKRFDEKKDACALEISLIKELNTQDREIGYNIHSGGMGGYTNYENHRKRFSGEGNPMYGKSHSKETKMKSGAAISEWRNTTIAGKEHSTMHRNRMIAERNWNYGKPMPEERKQKMIETKKANPTKHKNITKYILINTRTNEEYVALGQAEYHNLLKSKNLSSWTAEAIMRNKPTKSKTWNCWTISREKIPRPGDF